MIHNKARLVPQGYSQMEGVDYDETVRAYVIHLLGTYVNILYNWLIF